MTHKSCDGNMTLLEHYPSGWRDSDCYGRFGPECDYGMGRVQGRCGFV